MDEAAGFITQFTAPLQGPVRFQDETLALPALSANQIAAQLWLIVDLEVKSEAELRTTLFSDPITAVAVRYRGTNDRPPIPVNQVAIVAGAVFSTSVKVRSELEQLQLDPQHLSDGKVTYRSSPHAMEERWAISDDLLEPVEFGASIDFIKLRNLAAQHLWYVGKKAANWLWWRGSGMGEIAVQQGPLYWSSNALDWLLVPTAILNHREIVPAVLIDESIQRDFATLGDASMASGFGREVLEESWSLRLSQPRSSLLLAVAAAEVGFKEWASIVAEDTGWLLENIQSPPLDKMLGELLPALARDKGGVELPFPMSKQHIVKKIRQGVEVRNTIAHAPSFSRRHENAARLLHVTQFSEFQEIILCVSDLLWLLDYLALRFEELEADWALERMRPTSRTALGLNRND